MKCVVFIFICFQVIFAINFDSLAKANGIITEIDAVAELQYYKSLPAYFRIKIKNILPEYTFPDIEFGNKTRNQKALYSKLLAFKAGVFQNVDLLANYAPSVKITIKKKSGEVIKDVFIEENAYYNLESRNPYEFIDYSRLPEKEMRRDAGLYPEEWHTIHYDLGPFFTGVDPGEYILRIVFKPHYYMPVEISKEYKIKFCIIAMLQEKFITRWLNLYNSYYTEDKNNYSHQKFKEAMLFRNDFKFKLSFLQEKITAEEVLIQKDSLPKRIFSTVVPFLYLNFAINESTLPIRSELVKYFPDILHPLALCLEYETELSLKNKAKAKTIKEQILTSYPEYKKKIEDVDSGNGIIRRLKKIIAEK